MMKCYMLDDFASSKRGKDIFILSCSFVLSIMVVLTTGFFLSSCIHFHQIVHSDIIKQFRPDLPSGLLNYGPQNKQRILFILLTVLSPLYVLLSLYVSRKIYGFLEARFARVFFYCLRVFFCIFPVVLFAFLLVLFHKSSYMEYGVFKGILHNLVRDFFLFSLTAFIAMSYGGYFVCNNILIRNTVFSFGKFLVTLVAIIGILFATIFVQILNFNFLAYLPLHNITTADLASVFYSISQVVQGKTLLANLTTQYGLFAELLSPLFKVIGLSVFKFSLVMMIIELLAFLIFYFAACKLTNSYLLGLLFIFAVCYISGNFFVSAINPQALDISPYYQYWPIRIIFPALSLLAFMWYANNITVKKTIIISLLITLALIWNFESGIPIFGATFAYFFSLMIFEQFKSKRLFIFKCIVIAIGTIIILLGFFALYLEIKSNFLVHWSDLFKYPHIFFELGISQLPIPRKINMWMVVLGIYLFGMLYAFYSWLNKKDDLLISCIFYISILGIGMFTYYQYRAHVFNLLAVSWPALLLILIFARIIFDGIRFSKLPKIFILLGYPCILLCLMMSFSYVRSFHVLYEKSITKWSIMLQSPVQQHENKLMSDYIFIKEKLHGDRFAEILVYGQAELYGELNAISDTDGPGFEEIFMRSDYDGLLHQLLTKQSKHIFIDTNNAWFPVLEKQYRVESETSSGTAHLVPR